MNTIREIFQTIIAGAVAIGAIATAFKWVPWLWRWLMKTKHLRNKEWPIRIILRGHNSIWFEGRAFIEIRITFCLDPQEVPVTVQTVQFQYFGDWFDGLAIENESDYNPNPELPRTLLTGCLLTVKGQTAPYTAIFRILAPKSENAVRLKPTLVIEAEGLPCMANLEVLRINKEQ